MYDIVSSLVIYENDQTQLIAAIDSFLNTNLKVKLVLVDHSVSDSLREIKVDDRIEYYHNPLNPGFGAGHNFTLRKFVDQTKYFLFLNPDIYFSGGVVEDIIQYMDRDDKVGLIMPKILYPNGETQYLAKLLPSPFDFFLRRVLPNSSYKRKMTEKFELRFSGYDTIMEAPYLSGCFMIFKNEVLKKLKGFDENIFMHLEDLDISRRCNEAGYKTIFYPRQVVYHDHKYKSFFTVANLKMYSRSAICYFNKFGWFIDSKRKVTNKRILSDIKKEILKS